MSVKASELPDLIAAAVRKAVDDKYVTDESLAALGSTPFTLGMIPEPGHGGGGHGRPVAESASVMIRRGIRVTSLDGLRTPETMTKLD